MIEPFFEAIFDGIVTWATQFAPKPIRIGCTVLLILVVIGILIWVLLARR